MNTTPIKLWMIWLALLGLFTASVEAQTHSDQLDLIKSRNTLIVGVKADYPPWGFYADDESIKSIESDSAGGDSTNEREGLADVESIIGLEPDLANDIANRLGVDLKLVRVTASNRITLLEEGAIDLLIATMGDTAKRRNQTGIIEPSYYSSGASIIVPNESKLKSWADLYGQPVCLSKNAYFNRELIERFLLKAQEYEGTRDNQMALNSGACMGWIFDDTALAKLLQEEQWQAFKTPLKPIMVSPWAIAVRSSEKETEFGQLVSDAIIDWHRTGKLVELEKKWDIASSQFISEQNKTWSKKDSKGQYVCQRQEDGSIATSCLSRQSVMTTFTVQDNWLSNLGVDFPPVYDQYSRITLLKGIGLTLILSLSAIVGSLVFGIASGTALFLLPVYWSWPLSRLNDVFRMTPPLLNLYILFFGIGGIAAMSYGIQFNAIAVALLVFSLYAGSSNAVLLTQALRAETKLHPRRKFKRKFSSAFRHAYEGLNSNSVNIVKAVGLASMIAVPELVSSANSIIAEYGNKFEMMTFLLVFYFLIVYSFIYLLGHLQKLVVGNNNRRRT